jgi:hypothetical protein
MWKFYLAGGAIVIALAVGWFKSELAEAETRGRLEHIAAQYNAARDSFEAYQVEAAARIAAQDSELVVMNLAFDTAKVELDIARQQADHYRRNWRSTLAQASEEGLSDSTAAEISGTMAALEVEVATCTLSLSQCEQIVFAHEKKDREQDQLLTRTQDQLNAANQTIGALQEGRGTSKLPWLIAGTATALLVASLVFAG